jgi:hypothetical protein
MFQSVSFLRDLILDLKQVLFLEGFVFWCQIACCQSIVRCQILRWQLSCKGTRVLANHPAQQTLNWSLLSQLDRVVVGRHFATPGCVATMSRDF